MRILVKSAGCLNFTMYEIARIAQVWDGTKASVSEKVVVGDEAY